jgi:hypothetical protein
MEIIVESAAPYAISALVYISILSYAPDISVAAYSSFLYVNVFFAYMAVESHPSSLAVSIS